MQWSRRLLALVLTSSYRRTTRSRTEYLTVFTSALAVTIAIHAVVTVAAAQSPASRDTPLHVPTNRFEFVASGDTQPPSKVITVHNGGMARLTDVRMTRLVYADSSRGAGWLVVSPRQSAVAPDELAIVGSLCVETAGLPAGAYRATAAISSREAPEPVAITITLVVTDAGARARRTVARCGTADTK